MRSFLSFLAIGSLALALGDQAKAQDSVNAFGGYPAGITSGSSYGWVPGGFRQGYTSYPSTSGTYFVPQTRYYSSGFLGGVPGTVTYGSRANTPSANAAYYGYGAPRAGYMATPNRRYGTSSYYYAPGTYYAPTAGAYRRGLLGRSYYRR